MTEETSALQEHALSDKKGEVIISGGVFVEIYRVRVKHMMAAQAADDELKRLAVIMLQVTLFDGKPPTADEIRNLYFEDFNAIIKTITQ